MSAENVASALEVLRLTANEPHDPGGVRYLLPEQAAALLAEMERLRTQRDEALKMYGDRLAAITQMTQRCDRWSASCTGRHGSQMPCVQS